MGLEGHHSALAGGAGDDTPAIHIRGVADEATPARGGEIAPEDILVKKGETPFKPGPIVSEFQRAGLPAAIEKGKIIRKHLAKGSKLKVKVAYQKAMQEVERNRK